MIISAHKLNFDDPFVWRMEIPKMENTRRVVQMKVQIGTVISFPWFWVKYNDIIGCMFIRAYIYPSCKYLLLDVFGQYMFWLIHNTTFISIQSSVGMAPADFLFLSSGAAIIPHPSKVLEQQLYELNPLENWSTIDWNDEPSPGTDVKLLGWQVLSSTQFKIRSWIQTSSTTPLVFGAIFCH